MPKATRNGGLKVFFYKYFRVDPCFLLCPVQGSGMADPVRPL